MPPLWFQAAVLGLVQGLTEFLPISSSAHLILVPTLTGWPHLGKAFDVALHFGTFLAAAVYFRRDLFDLLRGAAELSLGLGTGSDPARKMVVRLILASLPAVVIGFCLDDFLEHHFGGPGSITIFLALFAVVLGYAEKIGIRRREMRAMSTAQVLLVGFAQALALVPGVSRSGATMAACLLVGLTRSESARFSFLMALPITAGAFILRGIKLWGSPWGTAGGLRGLDEAMVVPCLVGIAVSAASGWLCIHWLMGYLRRRSFYPFVIYRLVLAGLPLWWIH